MPRFVVLRHETPPDYERGLHWDLMLETGSQLSTWALAAEPSSDRSIEAEKLADHRSAYLDYDGPVSGNRGSVSRWDAGEFEIIEQSDEQLRVRLNGERFVGTLSLRRTGPQNHCWTAAFSSV